MHRVIGSHVMTDELKQSNGHISEANSRQFEPPGWHHCEIDMMKMCGLRQRDFLLFSLVRKIV